MGVARGRQSSWPEDPFFTAVFVSSFSKNRGAGKEKKETEEGAQKAARSMTVQGHPRATGLGQWEARLSNLVR